MSRLSSFFVDQRWAMRYETLMALSEIVRRHVAEIRLSADDIEKVIARGKSDGDRKYEVTGGVAIIPIEGTISRYSSMVGDLSVGRGASVDRIRSMLNQAIGDSDVVSIVLNVNSPGGSSTGISDLADDIYRARAKKPILAFVDGMAASGAYWLASQADKIYGGSTAEVGSIGVYAVLYDESKAAANEGVKPVVVRAGDLKAIGVPGDVITDMQIAEVQKSIDAIYWEFVASVARGRGVANDAIVALAHGGTETGKAAVEAGLIDGVMSFEDVLSRAADAAKKHNTGAKAMEKQGAESAEIGLLIDDARRAEHEACRIELATLLSLFPGQESLVAVEWATGTNRDGIVVKASQAQQSRIADLERQAKHVGQSVGAQPTDNEKVVSFEGLGIEERIKSEWDKDAAKCRAEFPDFACYAAIRRVELSR